jgi:hypothetical protein
LVGEAGAVLEEALPPGGERTRSRAAGAPASSNPTLAERAASTIVKR